MLQANEKNNTIESENSKDQVTRQRIVAAADNPNNATERKKPISLGREARRVIDNQAAFWRRLYAVQATQSWRGLEVGAPWNVERGEGRNPRC